MANVQLIEIRENVEEFKQIANDASIILKEEAGIDVRPAEQVIPTIAYHFMRAAIDYLNKQKAVDTNVSLDLCGLMEIGVTFREGDAEKDANFTPYVSPGREFMALVSPQAEDEE